MRDRPCRRRPAALRRARPRRRRPSSESSLGALLPSPLARSARAPRAAASSGCCSRPSSSAASAPTASSRPTGSRCAAITASRRSAAASMLAVIGVFDFFGTILSGWLSDRFDNRWLLFFYYGLRGLSLIYLPFTDFSVVGLSAVRGVLRPRLGRDRAADRAPDGRAVRAGARQLDLRLDLRRPPARRGRAAFGAGDCAHRIRELSAGASTSPASPA